MVLTGGIRLGPYEISAPLGAGGMGEVYRARDRKLDWEVALKVLPDLHWGPRPTDQLPPSQLTGSNTRCRQHLFMSGMSRVS